MAKWFDNIEGDSSFDSSNATGGKDTYGKAEWKDRYAIGQIANKVRNMGNENNFSGISGNIGTFSLVGGIAGLMIGIFSKKHTLLYTLAGAGTGAGVGLVKDMMGKKNVENESKEIGE